MPARVPSQPQVSLTSHVAVARPVSEAVMDGWDNDLAYLLCKQVQPIASQFITSAPLAAGSMRYVYNRTPGVDVIRIDVQLNRGTGIGSSMTLGVAASAGTITIIGDGELNGSRPLDAGAPFIRTPHTFTSFFLVTGITPGTPVELIFTWTNISKGQGIAYVNIVEVPLADTNPVLSPGTGPTGEMGLDPSWPQPGNPVIDGSATTKSGTRRIVAQLDRARKDVHRHFQVATPEDATTAWTVTSGVSAFVPLGMHDNDCAIRIPARLLYVATANVWEAHIRYKCTGANTGHATFVITPVGGAPASTTINLPNSAVWATVTGAINFPTTGTDQECDVQFKADTSAASILLGLLGGTENEA
jgi:hypothetical protein